MLPSLWSSVTPVFWKTVETSGNLAPQVFEYSEMIAWLLVVLLADLHITLPSAAKMD